MSLKDKWYVTYFAMLPFFIYSLTVVGALPFSAKSGNTLLRIVFDCCFSSFTCMQSPNRYKGKTLFWLDFINTVAPRDDPIWKRDIDRYF